MSVFRVTGIGAGVLLFQTIPSPNLTKNPNSRWQAALMFFSLTNENITIPPLANLGPPAVSFSLHPQASTLLCHLILRLLYCPCYCDEVNTKQASDSIQ